MVGVHGLKKHPFYGSVRLGCLFFLLVAGAVALVPDKGLAQLRDEEYIRRQAQPYVSRFLKELRAYESDLPQARSGQRAGLIRLSRVCFNLGELSEHSRRLAYYEQGKSFAEILVKEQPERVEGQYWLGLNIGGVAEPCGSSLNLWRFLPKPCLWIQPMIKPGRTAPWEASLGKPRPGPFRWGI
jgi:hypothetical protein